jgi:hypothetical protein
MKFYYFCCLKRWKVYNDSHTTLNPTIIVSAIDSIKDIRQSQINIKVIKLSTTRKTENIA